MRRGWWLLLALAGVGVLSMGVVGSRALAVTADPWPNSPVLTRLFRMPGARADVQRLKKDLNLSPDQVLALQVLGTQEQELAQAGDKVADRLQARQLNIQIAAMRQDKDARARAILGAQYPAFRAWLRQWWESRVLGSGKVAGRLAPGAAQATVSQTTVTQAAAAQPLDTDTATQSH